MDEAPTVGDFRKAFDAERKSSIRVGDQVRLTGVVSSVAGNGAVSIKILNRGSSMIVNDYEAHLLEVIRQPFKRGEVVYSALGEDVVVQADEAYGLILVAAPEVGCTVQEVEAKYYERRP